MTAFLEIFLTFAAVLVLAAALSAKTKLNVGLAPLFVLCATMLWFSVWGCFDALFVAGILWFAAAALALTWLILHRKTLCAADFVTPASVFFVLASVAVLVYFAVRQPIPMEWDEFSFWSIAPKVVKTSGHIYTANPGNLRVTSYVPGLVMLDYAFQFIGASFVPWKVFAAYDILLFAIFAAVLSPAKKRDWNIAVPAAIFCLLLPFLGTVYLRIIYVTAVYMSSYADIPMGLLFGGALAIYFATEEKTPALLAGTVLTVTAASITKDMGFALSLIAAAIICFDLLFVEKGAVVFAKLKNIWAKLIWCVLLCGGPLAAFFGWAAHMKAFTGADRFDVGGSANLGAVQLVTTGVKELFSSQPSEHFTTVMSKMFKAFYSDKLTMFSIRIGNENSFLSRLCNGSGLTVVLLILCVLLIAFLAGDRRQKIRTAWCTLWSALGFVAFYIFNGFTYVYVFHDWQSAELVSYNRYIYPYYLGWMLLALVLLVRSLCCTKPHHFGRLFLILLCVVGIWRFSSYVRPQMCVIDYPDSYSAEMRRNLAWVDRAKTKLTEEDRIFFVSQADDGMAWFVHYYAFYPILTDYSLGGGNLNENTQLNQTALPAFFTKQQIEEFTGMKMTPENLCRYLAATGCTAIYIDDLDLSFVELYGSLFTDTLSAYRAGTTNLYRIETMEKTMRFVPVMMESEVPAV